MKNFLVLTIILMLGACGRVVAQDAGSAFALEGAAPFYKKGEGKGKYGNLQAAFD